MTSHPMLHDSLRGQRLWTKQNIPGKEIPHCDLDMNLSLK